MDRPRHEDSRFARMTVRIPAREETETPDMAAVAAGGSDMTLTILYMVLIVGVFYFLWWRPQQTQRKKMREMLDALAVGDRVMTAGGMIGMVRGFDGEMIEVEIAAGVIARFTKRAIIERIVDEIAAPEE